MGDKNAVEYYVVTATVAAGFPVTRYVLHKSIVKGGNAIRIYKLYEICLAEKATRQGAGQAQNG